MEIDPKIEFVEGLEFKALRLADGSVSSLFWMGLPGA
jgi:hypothetical protein